MTFSSDGADDTLHRQAAGVLRRQLLARGAVESETPDWTFLLRVDDAGLPNKLALSVVTLFRLPEQAVQLGKEAEVFYANISNEERATLPAEGKLVREHISEDFLRGYGRVQDHHVVVVDRSALDEGIAEVVERFYTGHTRR